MNSADRLCVVTFPVYYYIHQKQLTCSLIVAQYVITIIAVGSTVIASLPEPMRYISHFCLLPQVYNSYFYAALMLLSSIASLFSIILMVIVVVMLKKKFGEQFLSSHSYNRDLTHFLENQKRYTQTALISCCFTFCNSRCGAITSAMYLYDGSTYKVTVHYDVLHTFISLEFFQYGVDIYLSAKGPSECYNSWIPMANL
ncbi:unnamed protein product [Onchocerca ochengi]|uniref:G_PROTEIN_RECEP_F1_2 domain-containing protein n=1 Tax=Onchocerca ochengi TaxID=42157 RepID=A0A182EU26_ONCOC|nr:unnamed protein product [Onchocerca ochengi]